MSIDTPSPFGEAEELMVETGASLRATVNFHIGRPVPEGTIDIIDAAVALHVDRCHFNNGGTKLMILEHDFLPETGLKLDSTPGPIGVACEDTIAQFKTQVKRVKKAYRDAIDLVRQYNLHKQDAANGAPTKFKSTFCQDLKCDAIVMGTRGHGKAAGLILGSVARDVIAKAAVPVTVVK